MMSLSSSWVVGSKEDSRYEVVGWEEPEEEREDTGEEKEREEEKKEIVGVDEGWEVGEELDIVRKEELVDNRGVPEGIEEEDEGEEGGKVGGEVDIAREEEGEIGEKVERVGDNREEEEGVELKISKHSLNLIFR